MRKKYFKTKNNLFNQMGKIKNASLLHGNYFLHHTLTVILCIERFFVRFIVLLRICNISYDVGVIIMGNYSYGRSIRQGVNE